MRRAGTRALAIAAAAAIGSVACTSEDPAEGDPATRAPDARPSRVVLTPTPNPRTSQALAWRTSSAQRAGAVEIGRPGSDDPRTVRSRHSRVVTFPDWDYQSRHHTAVIRGLRPGTRYRYRVGAEGAWSDWRSFRTAHGRNQPWTFAYFGDAQTDLDGTWAQTAERAFREHDPDLMLHTGDLVDAPTDDGQWSDWFRALAPYRRSVNTIAAVGNHELIGDPELKQYRSHVHFPQGGPSDETTFAVDYQGVRFIALDTNHPDDPAQRRFLQDKLRGAGDRWTVVFFHKPMFVSVADRDSGPRRDAWLSTLETYGADLVLQGHDHVYARGYLRSSAEAAAGRHRRPMFAVSVAGGKYYDLIEGRENDWFRHGARRVRAAEHTSTYQIVRVTRDSLTYRSVIGAGEDAGEVLDRFRLDR